MSIFQTDDRDTQPGYTKLKRFKIGRADTNITKSLFQSANGDTYISSDFFTNMSIGKV